jgi:hypothetical protein
VLSQKVKEEKAETEIDLKVDNVSISRCSTTSLSPTRWPGRFATAS